MLGTRILLMPRVSKSVFLPLTCLTGLPSKWKRNASSHPFTTEHWKLELLNVLCWDCYFTCLQAKTIVNEFSYGQDKIKAATTVRTEIQFLFDIEFELFGRMIDPENFSLVTSQMRLVEQQRVHDSIGVLSLFHPDNPTGSFQTLDF